MTSINPPILEPDGDDVESNSWQGGLPREMWYEYLGVLEENAKLRDELKQLGSTARRAWSQWKNGGTMGAVMQELKVAFTSAEKALK